MSKRSEKRRDAAEEVCRALRTQCVRPAADFNMSLVLDYLNIWMRRSGKACYDKPNRLRKNQVPDYRRSA